MHYTVNNRTPYCADKLPGLLREFPNYIEDCKDFLITLEDINATFAETGENDLECQWCVMAIIYFYGKTSLY